MAPRGWAKLGREPLSVTFSPAKMLPKTTQIDEERAEK